ncbi:hypothetical protein BG006_002956 [Podila minutissima]|uniref:Uncharacterized protein n=1 Tax=Podila minutissima TaxID=64525 RepID=A0A9P5VN53_9FUNG|nr:hypothetical protein BG006_002956 [Podila minutissima]
MNPTIAMPQYTAEHDAQDMANMPTRPGEGNGAQVERPEMPKTVTVQDERQIELQKRNLALEEQLLEMQKRNLVLEEQLLEWQRRILAQDERLLEMQKRMEIFEKRRGTDTKMEEGKATVPDIKDKANAYQTTNQTSTNTLTLSTTTLSPDNKLSREADFKIDRHASMTYEYTRQFKFAAFVLSLCLFLLIFIDTQDHTRPVPAAASQSDTTTTSTTTTITEPRPSYNGICDHKEEFWQASKSMREFEIQVNHHFTRLAESIRLTPDHDLHLRHQREIVTLQRDVNKYRRSEEQFEELYQKHGCGIDGEGQKDEGYLFQRRRHEQGRKAIEDILREARELAGPPDLSSIIQRDHRAGVAIALGCVP